MPDNSLAEQYVLISSVVASYWFISITLVFVNKALLSGWEKLDAPMFITWYQCLVSVALCYAIRTVARIFPNKFSFPELQMDTKIIKKVLPLSVVFIGMITFNNLCLQHVSVSFYYIGRSLSTVFNVLLTYFILGQKTSVSAVVCCSVIMIGFYLGVFQEDVSGSFSIAGTIYGVLSSLFVSLFAIYAKKVLPVVNSNIWSLTFYNNLNACILFLPMMLVFGEVPVVVTFQYLTSMNFWFLMTIGGIFGFAIGYMIGLQIKVTSPLTHNISGTAKAAAQTVLATYWYNEVKPGMWWFSNLLVLGGSVAYARVRQMEMSQASNILPVEAAKTTTETAAINNLQVVMDSAEDSGDSRKVNVDPL